MGLLIYLFLLVFPFVCLWKIFEKAGRPGWASIVPIYNSIVLLEISGLNGWYILFMIIPVVGVVVGLMAYIRLAKNFGRSEGFGVGLYFLSYIFLPILAFGDNSYQVFETNKEETAKEQSVSCQNCGTLVITGDKFCSNCGKQI